MDMLSGISILAVIAAWGIIQLHGYPQAVSWLSLALKRHARSVEGMQARRAKFLQGEWIKELEG